MHDLTTLNPVMPPLPCPFFSQSWAMRLLLASRQTGREGSETLHWHCSTMTQPAARHRGTSRPPRALTDGANPSPGLPRCPCGTCLEPAVGGESVFGFCRPVPVFAKHRRPLHQELPFLVFEAGGHLGQTKNIGFLSVKDLCLHHCVPLDCPRGQGQSPPAF